MTDFNQKTHDTDVGSHGGQSRQMMEVFENQEFGSIRVLQEAGKTFFCASDVAKALGYVNPYAAVKRHCKGPLMNYGGHTMKALISCAYNMDNCCVELKFTDGSMIAIDTIAVENEVARNMYERSELDYLIYNAPLEYADLILNGDPETYLKTVTEYKSLDS